jgi:hypothetical protein
MARKCVANLLPICAAMFFPMAKPEGWFGTYRHLVFELQDQ